MRMTYCYVSSLSGRSDSFAAADLLIVGGKPIEVRKTDAYHLVFRMAKPYGVGDRIFDGLAILPRHILEKPYSEGKLGQFWSLSTSPNEWAGLGPFRLKQYVPGERLCWSAIHIIGRRMRKVRDCRISTRLSFFSYPAPMHRCCGFQSGETDVITRLGAENYSVLSRQARRYTMTDAGAGLEYNFLFFNLNEPTPILPPMLHEGYPGFAT